MVIPAASAAGKSSAAHLVHRPRCLLRQRRCARSTCGVAETALPVHPSGGVSARTVSQPMSARPPLETPGTGNDYTTTLLFREETRAFVAPPDCRHEGLSSLGASARKICLDVKMSRCYPLFPS